MKIKKLNIILLLLLSLIMIGAVSAADINSNDTKTVSTHDNQIVSVENDLDSANTDTNAYSKSSAKISSEKNTNKQITSMENDLDATNNEKNTPSDNTKNKASTNNNNNILKAKNDANVLTEDDGTYSDLRTEITSQSGDITLTRKNYHYTDGDEAGGTIGITSAITSINGNGAIIDMA